MKSAQFDGRTELRVRDLATALIRYELLDLIGMGTAGLQDRLPFADSGLLRYAGLLAQRPALIIDGLFGIGLRRCRWRNEASGLLDRQGRPRELPRSERLHADRV